MIKYRFKLLPSERLELLAKVQKGKASAKTIQKAQLLLASDDAFERQSETAIAATYYLSTRSVERIRAVTWVGIIADLLDGFYANPTKMTVV